MYVKNECENFFNCIMPIHIFEPSYNGADLRTSEVNPGAGV